MSTTTTTTHAPATHAAEPNYLNATRGLMSWLFTLDHKRIGLMYLMGVVSAFILGGFAALGVRTELWTPGRTMMSHDQYNQFFSVHGAVMVFLFIIPGIPAALGNFALPLMLGAKDVAFPRLNLMSFWLWLIGACFFVAVLFTTGLDTGWTFYTPYSITTDTNVIAATMGAFVLGFSSIFTGLNFMVTIHKMRPPGMSWFKLPLFLWGMYATALIQVLATPVLGITLLLLLMEKVLQFGIFNPALGGDPVLFQHFFWFYSHPAVYIMVLPAMAVASELISVHSRKEIFGYKFIGFSSVAIAVLGFLVWGHHMFTSGQSTLASVVFSFITFGIAIPSAIKVFNWLTTLYKGSIQLNTPMLYGLGFIWLFTIGGVTGLFLSTMSVDVHMHDTYFVVAHFHYVMVGGTLWAFLGGLHHWWPKMIGKSYSDRLGRWASLISFVGFNTIFFPQFVLGTRGMPRRYYDYVEEFQTLHQISTVGAYILLVGLVLALYNLLNSLFRGPKAPDNPWGAASLEWQTATPPIAHNFHETPKARDPYEVDHYTFDPALGGYVRKDKLDGTEINEPSVT
jgi:cytochrome c oxidase subunit I